MNVAPFTLLEELTDVPRLFVDLDERIRRQLASVAVADHPSVVPDLLCSARSHGARADRIRTAAFLR